MKVFTKIVAVLMAICMFVCLVGCTKEVDNSFVPAGVYVIDYINETEYKYVIDDPEATAKIWQKYATLTMTEDATAEIDTSYLLLRFYNEDVSEEVVFTIYQNGTCCLGRNYDELYKVENGRTAYVELVELYETSGAVVSVEDFVK